MGFHAAKLPCRHGPAEGHEGLRKNVDAFRQAREAVGPEFPLKLDCYMALTVPYAIKLARALEPYGLEWIEECLPPDDYEGYAQLKAAVGGFTMVATGEHEYTRYGFRQLIAHRCADILHLDVNWVGGRQQGRGIVAMASAHDPPGTPPGASALSNHLQKAFTTSPIAEICTMSPAARTAVPVF